MNERKRLVLASRERLSCDGHSCPLGSREAKWKSVETAFERAGYIRPLLPQPFMRHDDNDNLDVTATSGDRVLVRNFQIAPIARSTWILSSIGSREIRLTADFNAPRSTPLAQKLKSSQGMRRSHLNRNRRSIGARSSMGVRINLFFVTETGDENGLD